MTHHTTYTQAPVAQKVPYKILMGKLAKQKKREAKKAQEIKESGLVVARKRPSPAATAGGKNKVKHGGGGGGGGGAGGSSPYPVAGKMKGGMLFLSRDTINASQRRGGRR